ncbi:MAG: tetratricopeptide repeat protein [Candidatus Obscuribacterales bacterium]|nr:tetratricopeptide repeat protein [Candidatus Obscuribacterales bacterium]
MPIYRFLTLTAALLIASSFALSSCQLLDGDPTEEGMELLAEKKYSQAESIFQSDTLRQENKLREIKSAALNLEGAALKGKLKEERKQGERLANAYKNLATVLFTTGKYGPAEAAFEKAIEYYSAYFKRESKFVVECLHSLAAGYYKQGKLLEAEQYYIQELELEKKLLKPDSLTLAVTANNLAAIYQRLGDDLEAEKYFRWALSLCEHCRQSPKETDQLADILNNLALFYEKNGFYGDAREMVQRAIKLEDSQKGAAFSADKVRSLLVLAAIEKSTFELDNSEEHYRAAIELINKELRGNPALAASAHEKFADLLLLERKFDEAEPEFQLCLKACKEAYGPEHPLLAENLSEFSVLYRRKGNFAEAEKLLRQALLIQEKTIGVDTSEFLSTVHRLAAILAEEERYKEADQLYAEIMPKLKARIGPFHPFVADTLDNWSVYIGKTESKEKADSMRAQAKLMRKNIARSLHPVYGPELH